MSRRSRACGALIWFALAPLSGCQPPHADAAPHLNSARWVLTPSAIASLSSDHDTLALPEEIRLGDPFGRSALYLKFPKDWREHGRAEQAVLTLTPSDAAASDSSAISVEAWRVRSDWQPEELRAWSDKPELAPPSASTSITSAPPRELRIDVTDLVRFAAQNPERDFGLALLTRSGAGQGAAFATGMAGGNAPRLEIYVTRTR
jgi:hypothetical protein